VLILLLASGTSSTSSMQTDLLSVTRLAGYAVDSPSDRALTRMRLSALSSNQLQYVQFCLSLSFPGLAYSSVGCEECFPTRHIIRDSISCSGALACVGDLLILHMHDPREPHFTALKCILLYLQGTSDNSLLLQRSCGHLTVYTDADWAGSPDTRRSTSGYAVFIGDNLVSWSSKRQNVVSRSSAEAEYRAVANGVVEAYWLRQLLHELHSPRTKSIPLSTVIKSVQFISPSILSNTNTRSMLRLIFTLCVSV
jgi:hypothetical protein